MDYYDLAEQEVEEEELAPELLPVDARLSIKTLSPILISIFERAASVAPSKELIPGTSYTLFEAFSADNHVPYVQVTATDGERTIVVVADGVQVYMPGDVLLPPKRILAILKMVPTEVVKLEVVGNECTIRAGRAQWLVRVPGFNNLPTVPDLSNIHLVGADKAPFLNALVAARKAAATSTARTALMQIRLKDGALTGCDGARIHRQTVEGLDTTLDFTISLSTVDELLKALRQSHSDTFELGANDTDTVFRIDEDILIGKRMNLPFPDVDAAMLYGPFMRNTEEVVVNAGELKEAVKRVRVSADPDFAGVFLAIVPGRKTGDGLVPWHISVRARDRNNNAAQESVPCLWEGTKSRELCLNHHSLIALLEAHGDEDIALRLDEDTKQRKSPIYVGEEGFQASLAQMSVIQ